MNNPNGPIDPQIVQQAIEWMVKLQSGIAQRHDLENCEQWRMQNPIHDRALLQLECLSGNVKLLPKALAHTVLDGSAANKKFHSRRNVLKFVALLAGTGALSRIGYQFAPWQQMVADHGTGIGERRAVVLADGTQLKLNTDSAVDVHFNQQQRLIKLLKGEILVATGHPDDAPTRPFSVQTAQGNIRAIGTNFLVYQQKNETLVAVYEGAVEVRPDSVMHATYLDAGQQLRFTADKAGTVTQADSDLSAWSDGVIVAKNTRLAEFAKELNRYRHGYVICDPSAANIMISGVFPLDDIERVIASLEQALPVTAETRMRYWTILHKK